MKIAFAGLSRAFAPASGPTGSARAGLNLAACAVIGLVAWAGAAYGQNARTPSAPGAKVAIVGLKDGATIGPKTLVHFSLSGMTLAPAGTDKENTGHHHLLIDAALPPLDEPIPSDATHLHFGKAQTEAEVNLSPGPHTLQLLLGDKNHVPHSPPVYSEVIHVTVVETK